MTFFYFLSDNLSLQVFYHKNWNRFDGIALSLEDVEFMSNSTKPYANKAADQTNFST